jgi:hypothetical protein
VADAKPLSPRQELFAQLVAAGLPTVRAGDNTGIEARRDALRAHLRAP